MIDENEEVLNHLDGDGGSNPPAPLIGRPPRSDWPMGGRRIWRAEYSITHPHTLTFPSVAGCESAKRKAKKNKTKQTQENAKTLTNKQTNRANVWKSIFFVGSSLPQKTTPIGVSYSTSIQ